MSNFKIKNIALGFALLLLLGANACGFKGDLYMAEPADEIQEQAEQEENQK